MGKLYLVRHGKTALNATGAGEKIRGMSKAPLDAEGRKDAEKTADILRELGVERIVSSGVPRTDETASIIAKKLDIPKGVDKGIGPWNLGILEGRLVDDAWKTLQKLEANPKMRIPGGETYEEWWNEYAKTLWDYVDGAKGDSPNTALITHARNTVAAEPILSKRPAEPTSLKWAHAPEPGSVLEVCNEGGKCSAKLIFGKMQKKTLRS